MTLLGGGSGRTGGAGGGGAGWGGELEAAAKGAGEELRSNVGGFTISTLDIEGGEETDAMV